MTTGFVGADTDQLRDLALGFELGVNRLRAQGRALGSQLLATAWDGSDADAFRSELGRVLNQVQDAGNEIVDRATDLRRQAAEQDEASDPRSIFDKINDALHWPAQITRTIRNVQKIATDFPKMRQYFKDAPDIITSVHNFLDVRRKHGPLAWQLLKDEWKHANKDWALAHPSKGWEKLGDFIPQKISKYTGINLPGKEWAGKALKHLDEAGDAAKPWVKLGSRSLGKLLPGLDIGLGVHQMLTSDSAYDKVSGGMSAVGGALVLLAPIAGPAAPIVAGVGLGLGIVSAGMDIGKAAYDNIPAVKNAADAVGGAIGDGAKKVGKFFGSLF